MQLINGLGLVNTTGLRLFPVAALLYLPTPTDSPGPDSPTDSPGPDSPGPDSPEPEPPQPPPFPGGGLGPYMRPIDVRLATPLDDDRDLLEMIPIIIEIINRRGR